MNVEFTVPDSSQHFSKKKINSKNLIVITILLHITCVRYKYVHNIIRPPLPS